MPALPWVFSGCACLPLLSASPTGSEPTAFRAGVPAAGGTRRTCCAGRAAVATAEVRFTRGPRLASTLAAETVLPLVGFATWAGAATSAALSFRATCFASLGRTRVCSIRWPLLGALAFCDRPRFLDGACGCQALPRHCIRGRRVGAVRGNRHERDPGDDARYDGRVADRRHRVLHGARRSGRRCARRLDGRSRRHHLGARARDGASGRLRVARSTRDDVLDLVLDRRRDGNGRGR